MKRSSNLISKDVSEEDDEIPEQSKDPTFSLARYLSLPSSSSKKTISLSRKKQKASPANDSALPQAPQSLSSSMNLDRAEIKLPHNYFTASCSYTESNLDGFCTTDDNDKQKMYSAFKNALSMSFNESLIETKKFLYKQHLQVSDKSSDLIDILNGKCQNTFSLASSNHPGVNVKPVGLLLLYCLACYYDCVVYLFSTRAKPMVVDPKLGRNSRKCMAILLHKDSYLQKTTWFQLHIGDNYTVRPKITKVENMDLVARKFYPSEKKSSHSKSTVGTIHDERIIELITEEAHMAYNNKWNEFKSKKNSSRSERILSFKQTLSLKSLPNNVIANTQTRIEDELSLYNQAPTWVAKIYERLKRSKKIELSGIIDKFIAILETRVNDDIPSENTGIERESSTVDENDKIVDQGYTLEYRTVSRSLKKTINPNFDYATLLQKLTQLQSSTSTCMRGLSKVLEIYVDLILSEGLIGQNSNVEYLKYQSIDLFNCGLSKDFPRIAIINSPTDEYNHKFSHNGFMYLLSACIGRKNPEKKNDPIVDKINSKLDILDVHHYTTTPCLTEACAQLFTNFMNMYSWKACQKDLRIAINLLLKLHLSSGKVSNQKKPFEKKKKKTRTLRNKARRNHKQRVVSAMNDLFRIILKGRGEASTVRRLLSSIFSTRKYEDPADNDTVGDLDSEIEQSDDEEEYSEDQEQEEKHRDLDSGEINALTSVLCMLCQSPSIQGTVDFQYVKKQLYLDKQESIPDEYIEISASLLNSVKDMVPKKGEEFCVIPWLAIRKLRNVLVKFVGAGTSYSECAMTVKKIEKKEMMAINVNFSTLYLLFCKDHRLYKDQEGTEFTSKRSIKSREDKHLLFSNLFRCDYICHILKQRNLKFHYSVRFVNEYDMKFLGFKKVPVVPEACHAKQDQVEIEYSEDDKKMVKKLVGEVKQLKKECAHLGKTLVGFEKQRMDCGHRSRKFEKKNKKLDQALYAELKQSRENYNRAFQEHNALKKTLKGKQCDLYVLNKKLNNQAKPQPSIFQNISPTMKSAIHENQVSVIGIDPGVVTSASGIATTPSHLFQSLNRYQALEQLDSVYDESLDNSCDTFTLTAKKINNAVMKPVKHKVGSNTKKLMRGRVHRRHRLERYAQKVVNEEVKSNPSKHLTFVGDYHCNPQKIKGHQHRSIKKYIKQLDSNIADSVYKIDEFRSTVTCCYCFQITVKQPMKVADGKIKRNQGAVVCMNQKCPRRMQCKATTTNRDENGARNIALIGFSMLVSADHQPLPCFQRSNNPDKYTLSSDFSVFGLQAGDSRTSGEPLHGEPVQNL